MPSISRFLAPLIVIALVFSFATATASERSRALAEFKMRALYRCEYLLSNDSLGPDHVIREFSRNKDGTERTKALYYLFKLKEAPQGLTNEYLAYREPIQGGRGEFVLMIIGGWEERTSESILLGHWGGMLVVSKDAQGDQRGFTLHPKTVKEFLAVLKYLKSDPALQTVVPFVHPRFKSRVDRQMSLKL